MEEQILSGEQMETEDILRMVAEIEGLSYEESIAAAESEETAEETIEEKTDAEETEEPLPV